VVGDPVKKTARGVPLGAVTAGTAWLWVGCVGTPVVAGNPERTRAGERAVAVSIRCVVQWASAPRCAAPLTWSVTAVVESAPVPLASAAPVTPATPATATCAVPAAWATPISTAAAPTMPIATSAPSTAMPALYLLRQDTRTPRSV
jgi:hypothetical protein